MQCYLSIGSEKVLYVKYKRKLKIQPPVFFQNEFTQRRLTVTYYKNPNCIHANVIKY